MKDRARLQYKLGIIFAAVAGCGALLLAVSGRPIWAIVWIIAAAVNVRLAVVNRRLMN